MAMPDTTKQNTESTKKSQSFENPNMADVQQTQSKEASQNNNLEPQSNDNAFVETFESGQKYAKDAFQSLKKMKTSNEQFALVGAVLGILASFAPWWAQKAIGRVSSDTDLISWNLFEWPLYIGGIFVILLYATLLAVIVSDLVHKPIPKISQIAKSSIWYMGLSSVIIALQIFIFSAYVHPQFSGLSQDIATGVSWGAYLGIIGSLIVIVAGAAQWQAEKNESKQS